jgi:hypothetical protein
LLPLHLHQVGERTCTSKLSSMLGTRRYPRAYARGTLGQNPKSNWSFNCPLSTFSWNST